jgi:hypothetical protein
MVAAYLMLGCEEGWPGEGVNGGGSGLSGFVQENENAAAPNYNRN